MPVIATRGERAGNYNLPHMTTRSSLPFSESTTRKLAFATIYLVWGSSFLASKIMVQHLPVLLTAGVRFLVGGALLAALSRWRREPYPAGLIEWRHCAVMALLTVILSNGINSYALRVLPSNQSALLNSSSALWIALLGTVGPRGHRLSAVTRVGLTLGFIGVGCVLWPKGGFVVEHFGWQIAVVAGCLAWALGTLYYRLSTPRTAPLMFTAMQMMTGGLALFVAGIVNGDAARWSWAPQGIAAFLYLTLVSSAFAYCAYIWLMRNTTPAKLGTYAYVNPAIATVLGWAVLGETLGRVQVAGTLVILAGVLLITVFDTARASAPTAKRSG